MHIAVPCQPTFTPAVIAFTGFSIIWEAFILYDTNGRVLNLICSKNVMLLRELTRFTRALSVWPFLNLYCNLITLGFSWRWFWQTEQKQQTYLVAHSSVCSVGFSYHFPREQFMEIYMEKDQLLFKYAKAHKKMGLGNRSHVRVNDCHAMLICLLLCTQYTNKIR